MVSPLQGTAKEKLRTITAIFKDLEQRMIQYVTVRDSLLKEGTVEFARREQELCRELNEPKGSWKVNGAINRERHILTNQKTGFDPVTVISEFFAEIARFYATASPQHREEIAKLFKGYPQVAHYFESFLNYASRQMTASPDEADVWFGMSLIIIALEAGQYDFRDSIMDTLTMMDAAKAAGVNPGPVIDEIVKIVPEEGARLINRPH